MDAPSSLRIAERPEPERAPLQPSHPLALAAPSLRLQPGLLAARRPQRHPRRSLRVTQAAKDKAAFAPLRAGGCTNGGTPCFVSGVCLPASDRCKEMNQSQRFEYGHVAARSHRFVLVVNATDPPQLNTHPGTLSRSRYVGTLCPGSVLPRSRRKRLAGCIHKAPASRTSAWLVAGRHFLRSLARQNHETEISAKSWRDRMTTDVDMILSGHDSVGPGEMFPVLTETELARFGE